MSAIVRGDAARIPLADETVDLIVTSPPYFALRGYQDGGSSYDGQIGGEPTPQDFLEALWAVTAECQRVLKKTGSIFVNLGDKMAGSGGHNNSELARAQKGGGKNPAAMVEGFLRDAPTGYNKNSTVGELIDVGGFVDDMGDYHPRYFDQRSEVRGQSLMFLPERYRIGCIDRLGLVGRAALIWSKPAPIPEGAITNRVHRSHEDWVHLTKVSTGYYDGTDMIRLEYKGEDDDKSSRGPSGTNRGKMTGEREESVGNFARNPKGKMPGSVWEVATEGLRIPQHIRDHFDLPKHFAPFPTEWPYRLISGWSPAGICLGCGEGRRPVTEQWRVLAGYVCACTPYTDSAGTGESSGRSYASAIAEGEYASADFGGRLADRPKVSGKREYHFEEWKEIPPTRPAVVLDPFGGSGTTAMVARSLGRFGVNLDMSASYCKLAHWSVFESNRDKSTTDKEAESTVITFDL